MGRFKVGLIGVGTVSSGYGSPEEGAPYCHIGGLLKALDVAELVAVVEPNGEAWEKAQQKWGLRGVTRYGTIEAMLAGAAPDVVTIASPARMHMEHARRVIECSNRRERNGVLFIEKPPTCSSRDMHSLYTQALRKGWRTVASYTRSWDLNFQKGVDCVRQGMIGAVTCVVGYCGGPVLTHASHQTQMLLEMAGVSDERGIVQVVDKETHFEGAVPTNHGEQQEPFLDYVSMKVGAGQLRVVQIGTKGVYGAFYVDVYGTNGMVRAGAYIPCTLMAKGQLAKSWDERRSPFEEAYRDIARGLTTEQRIHLEGREWMVVHDVCLDICETKDARQFTPFC